MRDQLHITTAFVARGDDFADALSASTAAAVEHAPLLLTEPDYLPDSIAERLGDLDDLDRVFVIGGSLAVSDEVLEAIKQATGIQPVRLSGKDRYDTAAAVVGEVFAD